MTAKQITWTTHRVGAHVVHADSGWNNGNSPVGLALAVRLHQSGKMPATDVAGGTHVVHADTATCVHCPAREV